jgi:hypothetical protein
VESVRSINDTYAVSAIADVLGATETCTSASSPNVGETVTQDLLEKADHSSVAVNDTVKVPPVAETVFSQGVTNIETSFSQAANNSTQHKSTLYFFIFLFLDNKDTKKRR